ncbi:MAG: lambda-exonuclease family protein, partial [Sulfuricella sp.]
MKRHDLIQGTPEWHEFRATHFGGSDAPAMMGVSPYKTRTELLKEKAVGISREVDPAAQRRFDDGHRYEAMARPLAAAKIGEEIYPVVGSDGVLGASLDGMTMLGDVIWEHKSMNDEIRACFSMDDLPLVYRVQCEHNLRVSGAERCLFSATKWDADGQLIEERHIWITPDLTLRSKIIAGWDLFTEDLSNFRLEDHAVAVEKPVGKAPETLPALHIEVTGMVTASNLEAFSEHAIAVFQGIKTDLATDDDFASAEKT